MLIIQNGTLIDPANDKPIKQDLWIDNNKIVEPKAQIPSKAKTINAKDCWVTPGLLDAHCNLCDPGYSSKESIESGSKAAVAGGFTTICTTPNTKPVADCITILEYIKGKAKESSIIDVLPMACVSKSMEGKEIVEMESLSNSGSVAFYDTNGIKDLRLFKIALQYASSIASVIISTPQDTKLTNDGVMHHGEWSIKLGLNGIPEEAETTTIASQIEVLRTVPEASLHLSAISCARSIELIRRAKEEGLKVTAGVAAHQLIFTDKDVAEYNCQLKVNPPLRSESDRQVLIAAVFDGTIDVITSHHNPQSLADKSLLFQHAPFGITGLETALPSILGELVNGDINKMHEITKCFTSNARRSLKLDKKKNTKGNLQVGQKADVIIIDPQLEWVYSKNSSYSQSQNSPHLNQKLKGRVTHTIKNGEIVWSLDGN